MSWWTWLVIGGVVAAFLGFNALRGRLSAAEIERVHLAVKDGAVLLDVRTPAEFRTAHIDGALNIPVQELARNSGRVGRKNRPVIVYCRTGSRSAHAVTMLQQLGFKKVLDMKAMGNWSRVVQQRGTAAAAANAGRVR